MVMALAGNKADLLEARKVAAEASFLDFCFFWFSLLFEFLTRLMFVCCDLFFFFLAYLELENIVRHNFIMFSTKWECEVLKAKLMAGGK